MTSMSADLKRKLRAGLLFFFALLIFVVTGWLLQDGRLADATSALLFWPVVYYTVVLSVANGMPNPNGWRAWLLRLAVGLLCIGFIVAFWVVIPEMTFTFVMALVGVLFATLVEALAPAPFVAAGPANAERSREVRTPGHKADS